MDHLKEVLMVLSQVDLVEDIQKHSSKKAIPDKTKLEEFKEKFGSIAILEGF